MSEHSAHITTDRSCLDGDMCDVVVLRDEVVGYTERDGVETPNFESAGPPVFHTDLPIRHDAETMDGLFGLAATALSDAGWRMTHGAKWSATGTGYTIPVERDL